MRECDFWESEIREIFNRINGFFDMERSRQQTQWEMARWQSTVAVSPHAKKGVRIKPRDLVVFPWEDDDKTLLRALTYTEEEKERRFAKMDRFMKNKANGKR